MPSRAILLGALLLAGSSSCTIEIDHGLIGRDRGLLGPDRGRERGPVDATAGVETRADAQTTTDRSRGDQLKCTPGEGLGCSGDGKSLVKCASGGWGTVEQSCAQYPCSASLRRCTGCDPAQSPSCSGSNRISCSNDGLPENVQCPLGCSSGSCCVDSDSDKHSGCAGDCNDNDASVHPGQTKYFSKASNGSFDFNCDGTEEKEDPDLVSCHIFGGSCVGAGWQGSVPGCGQQGSYVTCKKQGSNCNPEPPTTMPQACR